MKTKSESEKLFYLSEIPKLISFVQNFPWKIISDFWSWNFDRWNCRAQRCHRFQSLLGGENHSASNFIDNSRYLHFYDRIFRMLWSSQRISQIFYDCKQVEIYSIFIINLKNSFQFAFLLLIIFIVEIAVGKIVVRQFFFVILIDF